MCSEVVAVGPDLPKELGEALRTAFRQENCTALVEQLEGLIRTTITGVMVYGSMARSSRATELGESDVDLLVLGDESVRGGVFGCADGVQVDLHIQNRNESLSDPNANWIYAEGRLLFDARPPELAAWLVELATWKRENPDPWSQVDHLRNRVWAERLIERIIRCKENDPTAASLHEARLLAALPTLHAQAQRKRTTSIGSWCVTLRSEHPALAQALSDYMVTRSAGLNSSLLRGLLSEVYRSPQ
jgi:hypothetical protein